MKDIDRTGKVDRRFQISRRQFFRWASLLALFGALRPASPALAGPVFADVHPSALPVSRDSTVASAIDASDLPLRKKEDAIRACLRRRVWAEGGLETRSSPLDRFLARTSLAESRLGLANWPILDETEDLAHGHFSFPISPYSTLVDDGSQRFLLVSNTIVIANFRHGDYLEQVQRRMFDRAVWAMSTGRVGMATVEFDRGLTGQKAGHLVRLLSGYGVKTIVWGNEPNSPYAPWRDNLAELFEIFSAAADVKNQYNLKDLDLSLPGLAYYGEGEYLQKMIRTMREMQKRRNGSASEDLPAQRVADHYYGPVEEFLPRIRKMREVMAKEGAGNLKYDLTEVGNPTLDPSQQKATDAQLAEGHIPQLSSLAVGSGIVDRFFYYSLLGSNYDDSITRVENGGLVLRPSYRSFIVMAKLLARLDKVSLSEEQDLVRMEGSRSDGIDFTVVWSKVPDRDLTVDLPKGRQLFDALGQEVKEANREQVTLKPKSHPYLAGPARILIGYRS